MNTRILIRAAASVAVAVSALSGPQISAEVSLYQEITDNRKIIEARANIRIVGWMSGSLYIFALTSATPKEDQEDLKEKIKEAIKEIVIQFPLLNLEIDVFVGEAEVEKACKERKILFIWPNEKEHRKNKQSSEDSDEEKSPQKSHGSSSQGLKEEESGEASTSQLPDDFLLSFQQADLNKIPDWAAMALKRAKEAAKDVLLKKTLSYHINQDDKKYSEEDLQKDVLTALNDENYEEQRPNLVNKKGVPTKSKTAVCDITYHHSKTEVLFIELKAVPISRLIAFEKMEEAKAWIKENWKPNTHWGRYEKEKCMPSHFNAIGGKENMAFIYFEETAEKEPVIRKFEDLENENLSGAKNYATSFKKNNFRGGENQGERQAYFCSLIIWATEIYTSEIQAI